MNFFNYLCVTLFLLSCAQEPTFDMPGPVNLVSYTTKDTIWNGSINLNGSEIPVKCVSNFEVNGVETSTTFRFGFQDNQLGLETLVVKVINSSALGYKIYKENSVVDVFLESRNSIFYSNDILIDTFHLELIQMKDNRKDYTAENFYMTLSTKSTNQKNINAIMNSKMLKIKTSFLNFYYGGGVLGAEKYMLNVDLKGGSQYAPTPQIDYRPSLFSPNDFFFLSIPTNILNKIGKVNIKSNLVYSKKGKFFPAESGYILLEGFIFKNSISLKGYEWSFRDTANNTPLIKYDSLELQSYYMPI